MSVVRCMSDLGTLRFYQGRNWFSILPKSVFIVDSQYSTNKHK